MSFRDVLGQEEVARLFLHAFRAKRLAHAYILLGPEGVGKTLFAREASKLLLCQAPSSTGDACENCRACRLISAEQHPDVHIIQPDPGKRFVQIEHVKELQHRFSLKPVEGDWRVGIIREAESLTEEASNSLLKTLEEPPGRALLFLITTRLDALLPTIISRCQVLRFRPLSPEVIGRILGDMPGISEAELRFARQISDGSVGRSMAFLESNGIELRNWLVEQLQALTPKNELEFASHLLGRAEEAGRALEERRFALRRALDLMAFYYRDLLVIKIGAQDAFLYNDDIREQIERHARDTEETLLIRRLAAVLEARKRVNQNANLPLTLQNLAIDLARPD